MLDRRVSLGRVLLLILIASAALAGCSEKIVITQYPAFYTPDLKTIAVVPFRNGSGWRNAENVVSDRVAAALMANQAYKVYNRNDLSALMDESDLRLASAGDPAAAAKAFQNQTQVQAILVGTVTNYSATSNSQRKRDPIYAYNKNTGQSYIAGYRTYTHTRNESTVAATAALIRVADGSTIHATSSPASATYYAEGSPPKLDRFGCANRATESVVRQIVEQFAPVRKQIEVKPSEALRTATELYDNEWTWSDTFSRESDQMYVVLKLPACCDRNRFRLTIVRKDQRRDLAEKEIVWDAQYEGFGYTFNPSEIAAAGGGPGQYQVKFYSGPEPVMRHDFRIE